MKILITGGGTSEKIDDVRSITNHSTGKLGKELVTTFSEDYCCEVYYIHSKQSVLPAPKSNIHLFAIESVAELEYTIKTLSQKYDFDAIIHSMAVSDYTIHNTIPTKEVARSIAHQIFETSVQSQEDLSTIIEDSIKSIFSGYQSSERKISSRNDNLLIELQPTQKIIGMLRDMTPHTVLVGFKLLVDSEDSELLNVGYNLLKKNKCDFVLANDLTNITNETHQAVLIDAKNNTQYFHTKHDIALGLASAVFKKLEEKN